MYYKQFKRQFEQAARGHGSGVSRGLLLALAGPAYFLSRLVESAYEHFVQGKQEKVSSVLSHGVSHAVKAGTLGRVVVLAAVYLLAQYVALPLLALEIAIASYFAATYGAIGMVHGKDVARANSLFQPNAEVAPARVEKMSAELVSAGSARDTLHMYKAMRNMSAQHLSASPVLAPAMRASVGF